MPWLDHGIHSVTVINNQRHGMDCRVEPGNDDRICAKLLFLEGEGVLFASP